MFRIIFFFLFLLSLKYSATAQPAKEIKNLVFEGDWQRTVSISDGGIGPRLRRLSKADIDNLTQNGRIAMNNYLK